MKLRNKARRNKSEEEYKKLRNQCNRLVRKEKFEEAKKQIQEDPNNLWKIFNNTCKGQRKSDLKLASRPIIFYTNWYRKGQIHER